MADVTIPGLTLLTSIDRAADFLEVSDTSDSGNSRRTTVNNLLNITSQPLGLTDTQSPTNKTFDNTSIFTIRDDRLTLQDNADTTKQAVLQLSGLTTATTRTYTLPDRSSTLATLGGNQTFTGSNTFTGGTFTNVNLVNPTLTVDTVSEFTAANGVTVDGLNIKDGKLNTNNSVVTSNITDLAVTTAKFANGAITPDKLATGATTAVVATSELTTSATYADLTTTTDTVTVTIGANGLALVNISSYVLNTVSTGENFLGFAVSGASTVAASDTFALLFQAFANSAEGRISGAFLVTGLTAGSTTFKLKYKRAIAGNATYADRRISVIPL